MGKWAPKCTVSGTLNWYIFGKPSDITQKKQNLETELLYDPAVPLMCMNPKYLVL